MESMKYMPTLPSWSFLIEHPSGKKILYDLGILQDWRSLAPVISESLRERGWEVDVKEEVIDIIEKNGIPAKDISSIIWR